MQVRAEQIKEHLKHELKSVYLISGDEPLQVMEAADAIREQATAAGFVERDILSVDGQFDWSLLLEAGESLSLFGGNKLLDMRLSSCKIGAAGSKAMKRYLERLPPDKILLIRCPRLEKSCKNAAWVKAIAQAGVQIQIWDLSPAQTQAWVARRMRSAGLKPDDQAVRYLTERVEGNLLAAVQEINKLKLLHADERLTVDVVAASVADSSRFSVFDLTEAVLMQDIERIRHIVQVLHEEGTALPLLIWALADLLRQLNTAVFNLQQGQSNQSIMMRMPKNRQAMFQQAMKRMQQANWALLYSKVALLDQHSKGVGTDVSGHESRLWDEVFDVALRLSGKRLSPVR
uniref:DNA polymerase III subunit delta n=1 Tax=uncultured Thiotrichaceae bacterium TaxID=298394 RepID=A0A6S6SV69_9GAMM|nr:MAG: DNA polymerase III delta subunit (EC [uncultured Thiotrichaceae bacterium]